MKVEGIIYFIGILIGLILIYNFNEKSLPFIIGQVFIGMGLFGYVLKLYMWFYRKKHTF